MKKNYPTTLHPNQLTPRKNLRRHFPEAYIAGLAESIRAEGIMSPILCRPMSNGTRENTEHAEKKGKVKHVGKS